MENENNIINNPSENEDRASDSANGNVPEEKESAECITENKDTAPVFTDAAELPAAEAEVPVSPAPPSPEPDPSEKAPEHRLVWSFSSQAELDRKSKAKKARNGALIYAIVVTVMFLLCFSVLAVLLVKGYNGNGVAVGTQYADRVIYVHNDDGTNGLLTVTEVQSKMLPSSVGVIVAKTASSGEGSGIVLSEDGYIITNHHVIEDAQTVSILFHDGKKLAAEIVGSDELSDVALLKVDPADYKLYPAEIGDSDNAVVGEQVVAIGNPAGMEFFGTVTVGYISAINRNVKILDANGLVEKKMTLIQTDAALNFGNSGGALCDMYGKVIGINTMKLASQYVGINFAIPISAAMKVINEIKENGSYSGGGDVAEKGVSLGVSCVAVVKGQPLQLTETESVTPEATGIMIVDFLGEDVSAYGVLKLYDIITEFDGVRVSDVDEIKASLDRHHPGDQITVKVYRDGKSQVLQITLK